MLMRHDVTGTETDCPKPLSRKKLKQLMRQNHSGLTARALWHRYKRTSPHMRRELELQEKKLREMMEGKKVTPDGTTAKVSKTLAEQAEDAKAKPSIFTRLGGLFSNLRRRAERESARSGK